MRLEVTLPRGGDIRFTWWFWSKWDTYRAFHNVLRDYKLL